MRICAALLVTIAASGCIETSVERPYACARDAGNLDYQCPGGWICGLEGFCRDPREEGPWRCERDSGFGCASGWFCTIEGSCRSRDAGGPFPCTRADPDGDPRDGGAPNDCGNPAWWCGHRGMCQQVGVEAPYPCARDNDCEGTWRCSIEGRCIARPADSLNLATFPNVGQPELISPLRGAFGATHVALGLQSYRYAAPDGGTVEATIVVTAIGDGGILGLFREADGELGRMRLIQTPYGVNGLRELGFIECRVYAVRALPDGGSAFDVASATPPNPDSGFLPSIDVLRPLAQLAGEARLRTANRLLGHAAAFTDYEWSSHGSLFCGFPFNAQVRPLPGTSRSKGTRALDLGWVGDPTSIFAGAWILATDEGLFVVRETTSDFEQGDWRALGGAYAPNGVCGPAQPGIKVRHGRIKTAGPNVIASHLTLTLPDGGQVSGVMPFVIYLPAGFNPYDTPTADGGLLFPRALPPDGGACSNPAFNLIPTMDYPCPPCLAAYPHLSDFSAFVSPQADGGFDTFIEGRCSQLPNGGGAHEVFTIEERPAFASGNCKRTRIREEANAGLIIGKTNSQRVGRASRRGGVWEGESESVVQPILMDEPPELVVRPTKSPAEALVGNGRFVAVYQRDFGFVPFVVPGGAFQFGAQVEGQPSWIAADDGVYSLQRITPSEGTPVAAPPSGGFRDGRAGRGVVVYGRDGGAELLLSSFDTVYHANVSGVIDGGSDYGQLSLLLVPEAQVAVTALAASSPGPQDSFFARAYARLASGVVELRAETRTSWRVTDTGLPGNPLTVFSTGRHARAGYDDGSVFALPSRLRLAPALEREQQPAASFASACGQPWVIARGGVFRLMVDGDAAEGRWERVDLEAGVAIPELLSTPVDLFERGKLNVRANELIVFLGDGATYRIPMSCPGGG